jgi:hypothetical protein
MKLQFQKLAQTLLYPVSNHSEPLCQDEATLERMREQKQCKDEEEDRRRKKALAGKLEDARRVLAQPLRDKEVGIVVNFCCYFPKNARCSRTAAHNKISFRFDAGNTGPQRPE